MIEAILSGEKTATCCPREVYSEAELRELRANEGHVLTLLDRLERPRGEIRLLEVFETPWGNPDPRLVAGEGYLDADRFRQALAHAWDDLFAAGHPGLQDDTVLVVERFELLR